MPDVPRPKKARRRSPADPKKRGLPLGSPCPDPCPDCGAMLLLRRGRYDLFYGCERFPECRGSHGAHPDGRPLGNPANAATRKARNDAHGYFDRLWRDLPTGRERKHARRAAYGWLSRELGVDEAHIGEMDIEQCQRVIALVQQHHPEKAFTRKIRQLADEVRP